MIYIVLTISINVPNHFAARYIFNLIFQGEGDIFYNIVFYLQNEAQLLSLIDVPPPGQCGADCVTLVSVGCLISNLEHIQEPIKIKSIKIWNHSFKQKSQNQDHRSALIVILYKIPCCPFYTQYLVFISWTYCTHSDGLDENILFIRHGSISSLMLVCCQLQITGIHFIQ